MASVNVHCPRCQSAQIYQHGQNPKGHDRVRDTARTLKVGINTVIRTLKNSRHDE